MSTLYMTLCIGALHVCYICACVLHVVCVSSFYSLQNTLRTLHKKENVIICIVVTTIISYTIRLQSGKFCRMHACARRATSLLSQIPSKLYCPTKLCAVDP